MTTSIGGNSVTLKQGNKAAILRMLQEKSPLTKAEIAYTTQLTFATVSNLLSELVADGMVKEVGYAQSNGGRKPLLYSVNPNARLFVGIEVRVGKLVYSLTDLQSNMIHSKLEDYDANTGPDEAFRVIRNTVRDMLVKQSATYEDIGGIGVAIPGLIDYEHGVIIHPPNMPAWRNVPFRDMLQNEFHVPCYLEKDSYSAAFGEVKFGIGRGVDQLAYVMVDAGIGVGFVVDGKLYKGAFNGAGEIGHIVLDNSNKLCNCGKHGCLETVSSGWSLKRDLADRGLKVNINEFSDVLESGDSEVIRLFENSGKQLGTSIATLCNLFNPEVVVIGGTVGVIDSYFISARNEARQRMLADFANRVRIERPQLNELSGVFGAAMIALENFIASYGQV